MIVRVATNVTLHGASPWHPENFLTVLFSDEREAPRGKPVASGEFLPVLFSDECETPRGKPVASGGIFKLCAKPLRRARGAEAFDDAIAEEAGVGFDGRFVEGK